MDEFTQAEQVTDTVNEWVGQAYQDEGITLKMLEEYHEYYYQQLIADQIQES